VIVAAQLTPGVAVATVLAAGLMISEGLRSKRLVWQPRRLERHRLRPLRRRRRS
jgi:hypothetical protein